MIATGKEWPRLNKMLLIFMLQGEIYTCFSYKDNVTGPTSCGIQIHVIGI
jgi:hypothetical protein